MIVGRELITIFANGKSIPHLRRSLLLAILALDKLVASLMVLQENLGVFHNHNLKRGDFLHEGRIIHIYDCNSFEEAREKARSIVRALRDASDNSGRASAQC